MPDLSVIIPTYNEYENINQMIDAINGEFLKHSISGEIIIVDDSSTDGTQELVEKTNARLIIRQTDPGLSQSVNEGIRSAHSEICLVMDADFSHPPEKLWDLYNSIQKGADIAIGSRYVAGGGTVNWPFSRKLVSSGATFLCRIFVPEIHDPGGGFFSVRKDLVIKSPIHPRGYKILFEILVKSKWKKIEEIPFIFKDRLKGTSKLKTLTIIEFVVQLMSATRFAAFHGDYPSGRELRRILRFAVVGASGILVNMGILWYLTEVIGIYYLLSGIIAIETSIITNFLLNDMWTFKDNKKGKWSSRIGMFHMVSISGMLINLSILYILTTVFGVYYLISNFFGILGAFTWNFSVNRRITWK